MPKPVIFIAMDQGPGRTPIGLVKLDEYDLVLRAAQAAIDQAIATVEKCVKIDPSVAEAGEREVQDLRQKLGRFIPEVLAMSTPAKPEIRRTASAAHLN